MGFPSLLTGALAAGAVAGAVAGAAGRLLPVWWSDGWRNSSVPVERGAREEKARDLLEGEAGQDTRLFSMETFRRSRGLEMHRMVARVLPGADAALVRGLAEEVAGRKDGLESRHWPVWEALMARWALLEPAAALAWARGWRGDGAAGSGSASAKAVKADVPEAAAGTVESDLSGTAEEKLAGAAAEPKPGNAGWAPLKVANGENEDVDDSENESKEPNKGEKSGAAETKEEGRTFLVGQALKAWAKVNVEAALAALKPENPAEWRVVLEVLGESDPGRALVLARKLDREGNEFQINGYSSDVERLLPEWAARDPQAALDFALTLEDGRRHLRLEEVAAGWVRKDPEGCAAWIAGLDPEDKRSALGGLMDSTKQNAEGVAQVVDSLPPGELRFFASRKVAGEWAKKSPDEALAWVRKRFPEGVQRAAGLAAVADTVMQTDPKAALALMDEIGWKVWEDDSTNYTRRRLPGGKEGGESVEVVRSGGFPDPSSRHWNYFVSPGAAMKKLFEKLGGEDPDTAVRNFDKVPAAMKEGILTSLGPAWFAHDPEAAMDWLAKVPAREVNSEGMTEVLKYLPEFSAGEMRDWALRMPTGPLREALAARTTGESFRGDPESALAGIPFTDAGSHAAAAAVIYEKWAEFAPAEAARRMVEESAPPVGTLGKALENWTARDPAAASEWTAQLPAGLARDAAIGGLVAVLGNQDIAPDYPAAVAWALDTSAAAQRLERTRDLLEKLTFSTPEEELEQIRATLENSPGLSPTDRDNLLKVITISMP
jgi:hypothetical protein